MEWTQFLILILTLGGLFLWNRGEARADARKSDDENKQLRRDMIEVMRSIEQEIKDFHGRLCAIEERHRSKS